MGAYPLPRHCDAFQPIQNFYIPQKPTSSYTSVSLMESTDGSARVTLAYRLPPFPTPLHQGITHRGSSAVLGT